MLHLYLKKEKKLGGNVWPCVAMWHISADSEEHSNYSKIMQQLSGTQSQQMNSIKANPSIN